MPDYGYRLSDEGGALPSIEMLSNVWRSILSQDPSLATSQLCGISLKKSQFLKPRLTLIVELDLPITSEEQILAAFQALLANLVQEEISKTSKTSSVPSSSPTPE